VEDRFCPDDDLTRGQMASFLARAFVLPTAEGDRFVDDAGSVHEFDINRIAQAGISLGCGPDTFCPDQRVTRAQMATFLVRALGIPLVPIDHFVDDHEADINAVAAAGVTHGCGADSFCPDSPVTRGQIAALLRRALAP
jgi:hypothetical protein